jgi:hypothetical protein
MPKVGRNSWVIADGWIPPGSTGDDPALISHEAACILNANEEPANVLFSIFFNDRDPVGPVALTIPARRILHQNLEALPGAPLSRGIDYCLLIESDQPIVVQHTRLDSRQAANALMTTIAFPCD